MEDNVDVALLLLLLFASAAAMEEVVEMVVAAAAPCRRRERNHDPTGPGRSCLTRRLAARLVVRPSSS
jgi:hypothetical protein